MADELTLTNTARMWGNRAHLAGLAVAVVHSDACEIGCAGKRSAGGDAVDTSTVFRIASVTKTITAIGVMQLRDDGRLSLDDPVNDHLRNFRVDPPRGSTPVLLRHLLTHTAGIGEIPSIRDALNRQAWGFDEPGSEGVDLASLYRGVVRTEVPPGQKWAYTNHGFAILGQVIEDVTGEPLADRMDDRLFSPLGMASTSYRREPALQTRIATGHTVKTRMPPRCRRL